MDEQDSDNRYSEPCYFDAEQEIWVNEQYEPVKLPSTFSRLHGGQYGFDRPANNGMDEETTQNVNQQFYKNVYKAEKYKGVQFKDTITVSAFQAFKSEWNAHILSTRLSKKQQTKQLLSKGLAGKAKIIVSHRFEEQLAETEAVVILKFLEDKISASLGVLGKMELVKKVKQDVKEESLINLFLTLDTLFESTPKSDDQKIEIALDSLQSSNLKISMGKKEEKWKGDWNKFQEIANKVWGNMGGKDTESEEVNKLKHQLNFIQNQVELRDRAIMDRFAQQQQQTEEKINTISQTKPPRQRPNYQHKYQKQPFDKNECFTCGKVGHKAAFCPQKTKGPFAGRAVKKTCEYHGDNASHTTAECIVIKRQQEQETARGGRQEQKVRFSDTNMVIPPNVATNNNVSSKYNARH